MKNTNPYTLVFGKEPVQLISRVRLINEVTEALVGEPPTYQVCMVTGVRGSGKTVFMTEVSHRIAMDPDWIVVELNPQRDMLEGVASKLSSDNELATLFRTAKINLSFFGFGVEIGGTTPITDIETALGKMLASIQRKGKKVLVVVDEASNTSHMRAFVSAFQILIRQNLPLYMIMTGLYENIDALQNADNLTFLHRAPKVTMDPLNIGIIAENYKKTFDLDDERAHMRAKLTCGYPFAFQVLGYLMWNNPGDDRDLIPTFRQYMEEYVYEKLWSELSRGDQKIAYAISQSVDGKIRDIRAVLGLETNQFNPYRKRLLKKGLVDGSVHGYLRFTLPLFGEFVRDNFDGDL